MKIPSTPFLYLAKPKVFLQVVAGGSTRNVPNKQDEITTTTTTTRTDDTQPARFGTSMFNTLLSGRSTVVQVEEGKDDDGTPRQIPFSSTSYLKHYEKLFVRMEEYGEVAMHNAEHQGDLQRENDDVEDDDDGTVVILSVSSQRSTLQTTLTESPSSSPPKNRNWTVPFARPVDSPRLSSTICPTVYLANLDWYKHRERKRNHVSLAAVAAVLDPTGERILLTRRARHMRSFPNAWVLPGGGIDVGETLVDCVVRETREETGVELDPETVSPLALWESCYPTSGPDCCPTATEDVVGGIQGHYLVVYCVARMKPSTMTTNASIASLEDPVVVLDQTETDLAVWLTADDFAKILKHNNSNSCSGSAANVTLTDTVSAIAPPSLQSSQQSSTCTQRKSDLGAFSVRLENLSGIYPCGDSLKGIAQGHLFALEQLLGTEEGGKSHTWRSF